MTLAIMARRTRKASRVAFTDSFTRADGALGNGWYNGGHHDMLLLSGKAVPQGNGGSGRYDCAAYQNVSNPTWVEVDLVGTVSSGGRNAYLFLGTDANGVALTIDGTGTWILWQLPAYNNRASATPSVVGNTRVRLERVGNVYKAYSNGALAVTWNDSGGLALPATGIGIYSESDAGLAPAFSFDNVATDGLV